MAMVGTVFLTGLSGAGKTTLGKHVANKLGIAFVDTDDVIAAGLGMSIDRVFALHGEAVFREAERAAIEELCKADDTPRVVALGGGAMMSTENRKRLLSCGIIVYLTCSTRELYRRTCDDTNRPLLSIKPRRGETARQGRIRVLTHLKSKRDPVYRMAHSRISTTNGSIVENSKRLQRLIERLHEKY